MAKHRSPLFLLMCLCLLINLSSCQKHVSDGIMIEMYCKESMNETHGSTAFYLQGSEIIKKRDAYIPAWFGGTPYYARNKASEHLGKTVHEVYEEFGQLDDYYIDEHVEFYLYNGVSTLKSTVLYFKDGIQQSLTTTINGKDIQYKNEYLYLISLPYNKDGILFQSVEKICLSTNTSQIINYQFPYCESFLQMDHYNTSHVNSDDSIWLSIVDLTPIGEGSSARYISYLSYPNGKCYTVEPNIPTKNEFRLIFETEDGYGLLETNLHTDDSKLKDLTLQIRYVDRLGNDLSSEVIDCTDIKSKFKQPAFLNHDNAGYYDGTIYFLIGHNNCFYNYTYNLRTKKLTGSPQLNIFTCKEYQIVRVENNKLYNLS